MDKLKNLLRLALTQQARCLVMQSGQVPELILAVGRMQVSAQEAITAVHLQSLFTQLMPAELATLAANQAAKGYLQVPNVGRIQLLAIPADKPALRLYLPPEGAALFAVEWPLYSPAVAAQPLAQAAGQSFSAPAPLPLASPPAEPVIAKSMGYIPAGLVGQAPDLAVVHSTAKAAATSANGVASPGLQGLPAQMPEAVVQAPAILRPIQLVPSALAPAAAVSAAAWPQPSPPISAQGVKEPPQPAITFGPEQGGSAGISSGQNPIDRILLDMIKRKASDVHMTCGEPLCMRIDGDITRVGESPLTPEELEQLLMPMIPPRNQTEFVAINDTDFAYEIRGVGRFRVNLFRDKNGVGSVMRHIPSTILTAEQLSLPPAITKFCSLSKGLVLVTGPTGSGKSTTLAAMIDLINKDRADHILTVEDPIEFVHTQQKCLINQREVHKHTGSFSRALKAALREDPDIVLIGEMRDLETVAIAIETAETGHLVFGTLHTNTAVSTIDRIIDQFPTDQQAQIRMMLAASLRGVVAQTLLKKKKGGRVAAHEILVTNDAVSAMIREGKNHMIANHMQSQKADGNLLLNESLLRLVKDGVVDVDEALRKAVDRNSFIESAKRLGGAQPGQAPAGTPPGRPPHGGGSR